MSLFTSILLLAISIYLIFMVVFTTARGGLNKFAFKFMPIVLAVAGSFFSLYSLFGSKLGI